MIYASRTQGYTARTSRRRTPARPAPGYTLPAMDPTNCRSEQRRAVLFLCRHNAVRSQMAEALLRARFPNRYDVASAGTAPSAVHPLALRVLEEIDIPIRGLRSKHVEELAGQEFDIVATVCGQDEESCPFFPGGRQVHRTFSDPSAVTGTDEVRLAAFRATRDEIDAWIREAFGTHTRQSRGHPAGP